MAVYIIYLYLHIIKLLRTKTSEVMKKYGLIVALLLAGVGINQVKAQDDYNAGIFKHLSVGVNASTLGYGVDVASNLAAT